MRGWCWCRIPLRVMRLGLGRLVPLARSRLGTRLLVAECARCGRIFKTDPPGVQSRLVAATEHELSPEGYKEALARGASRRS